MKELDLTHLGEALTGFGAIGLIILGVVLTVLLVFMPCFVYGIWAASRRTAAAMERLEQKLRK